ncbi:hypothetical protein [Streptomyces sp. NPDC001296]
MIRCTRAPPFQQIAKRLGGIKNAHTVSSSSWINGRRPVWRRGLSCGASPCRMLGRISGSPTYPQACGQGTHFQGWAYSARRDARERHVPIA